MTTAHAIAIERLAQAASFEPHAEADIRAAWAEFRHALAIEDHRAIGRLEDQLAFLLRGIALSIAEAALKAGEIELCEMLKRWSQSGVPRGCRETLADIVICKEAA